MLVRFSVENFLSFDNKQEMSMIPGDIKKRDDHLLVNESLKVLRLGTIYGANASGKSSLIKAISFAKKVIMGNIPFGANKMYCRVREENSNKPTKFDFEFMKEERCYAYGFEIILKEKKILSEWLYEITETDQKPIFERETGIGRLDFNIKTHREEDEMRLKLTKLDFKSDSQELILSAINKERKITASSDLSILRDVYNWFLEDLRIIFPDEPVIKYINLEGKDNIQKINEIIQEFDTGIEEIEIKNITRNKLNEELTGREVERIFDSFKEATEEFQSFMKSIDKKNDKNVERIKDKVIVRVWIRINNSFYSVYGKINEEPQISTIRTKHVKSYGDFEFKEESDGTRRLFDLLEILISAEMEQNPNKVYIVDELERSLHPKLTYRFVELFTKILKEKKVQLIFTTHESTIMNQNLLRRDEVWFIEKNEENTSRLYSLDQFGERYDKKLDKAYLDGRYGAIPIFEDFSFKED